MTTGSDTAVVAVTDKGVRLAKFINSEIFSDVFTPAKLNVPESIPYESLGDCFSTLFRSYRNIVAVMAQGIVTRMIAPHVESKYTDPAVVTCDEVGRFAVSTLSGHEGGANVLAHLVSSVTGAQPVITTATEANRTHIVGVGCRRDTERDEIVEAINLACKAAKITTEDIRLIASAWIKKGDAGLASAVKKLGLYLRFLPESYYKNENYSFRTEDAPMKYFGIPGVAEPSAVLAAVNPKVILKREIYGDVTVAVVREMVENG